jgi:hypothetical protein
MHRFPSCGLPRALWIITVMMLSTAPSAFSQATSTFNGRVLDQGEAVLPGVTVTAANVSTGVSRTTVTNGDGFYYMPGLEPGVYQVGTELAGFAPSVRERVNLAVNATITLDFKLVVAGLNESLTVTGEAPMIEVTQSKVASSIEATELQNLPMITRTVSGMLALLPGATPMAPTDRSKTSVGSVSYAGASGTNVIPTVDGADNRDNQFGGPLIAFSTESLEQFQLATSQFTAADGRSAGAALTMVTKSGTNQLHGSGFIFERDRSLTATDFFSKQAGNPKVPFSRQQFGGSIGGPVVQNRIFFFGSVERINEDTSLPIPSRQFGEIERLVTAQAAGLLPAGLVNPKHPIAGPTPSNLSLYTGKANAQLNNAQSVMARYAAQWDIRPAVTAAENNDWREPENSSIKNWTFVTQHNLVLGNRGLNQVTFQANRLYRLSDVTSNITGLHYTRDFPRVNVFPTRLSFPTVNTGAGGAGGTFTNTHLIQFRDDVSLLAGAHAVKFGANVNLMPNFGLVNGNEHFPTLTFFDDPSVILSNSNGRYPQGFNTPGIVRQWQQANGGAMNGTGSMGDNRHNQRQFMTWFQDDWRTSSKLTLNMGVRWDLDVNYWDLTHNRQNAAMLLLTAIGNPYGAVPKTPMKDISPRVGLAYDFKGDGRRVLRGGYGLYFDQYNMNTGDIMFQAHYPLNALATLVNTTYGVGQLATYRFGIDPIPAQPTQGASLPPGAGGQLLAPDIVNPSSHVVHVGAQVIAANTTVSLDYTRSMGRHEFRNLNINPLVNGQRVLAPDFLRVFGTATPMNTVNVLTSASRSEYNAFIVKLQRRLPRATLQVHYTLAAASAYGGSIASRGGAAAPQDSFKPYEPGEWGPTGNDERHRVVATGVFELRYGIQLSPVFQAASARPYNLTAGRDLNADGTNNDRYVDPATGKQVSLDSARGDNTVVVDLRSTKFFALTGQRKVGVFVEAFNLLNNVNFGSSYTGTATSTNFRQPSGGFIPGIGYPRQVQLGA